VSEAPSDVRADARAAREALDRLLDTEAPALRDLLPTGFADATEAYVALMLEANARLNLTRVVAPAVVARLHLLDSLAALPLIDEVAPTSAMDLGSGGGVPGVVLAIARPDMRWTLVDSVRKKTGALASFVAALDLPNVTVLAERAEVLGRGPHRESFDLVAARACAALPVLAEYALPLVRVGGAVLAWKSRVGEDEMSGGARASTVLGGGPPQVVPSGVAALGDHAFVLIRKVAPTPARYPRRPGVPARRPLPLD
jgi:16S rRNA (guanine527-N7)-methyltransferase